MYDERIMKRFWSKVDVREEDECWEWVGAKNPKGYGHLNVDGKYVKAHHISYRMHGGAIEDGMFVLHHCDCPSCVNPKHLFTGTPSDNMRDMVAKGRHSYPTGSQHFFAKITEEDVLQIRELKLKGMTCRQIGKKYGLAKVTVSDILRGKTWKHVPHKHGENSDDRRTTDCC